MILPNNIDAKLWGPAIWKALYYVALGYPEHPTEIQKRKYKDFFLLLAYILPCVKCQQHFISNLKLMPISDNVMSSREKLFKWVLDYNNIVNKMQSKPEISYDAIIKQLQVPNPTKVIKKIGNKKTSIKPYLICSFIVLIILIFMNKNKKSI
jgi:hypothetical protein